MAYLVYIVPLIVLVILFLISYKGLRNQVFFDKYLFEVEAVLTRQEYYRLFTSGFLHLDYPHLIINLITLWFFSPALVAEVGIAPFLLIFIAGIVGGNVFSLFVHRLHGDYSSIGASGGVCALIFASIALFPGFQVGMFFLPLHIPGWLFALLYVLYSIYGIRSGHRNIGHDAHLGGGVAGMLLSILFSPGILLVNYLPILIVLVPTVVFIYLIITRPYILWVDNFFFKKHQQFHTIDDRFNAERKSKEDELNELLEKVSKRGLQGLSRKEKGRLEELSK
jgi:membrane associated rhomboid family serine protease